MNKCAFLALVVFVFFAVVAPVDAADFGDADEFFEETFTEGQFGPYVNTIPGYPCYRTISEISRQLEWWEDSYPDIADLMIVGYSYEARPLQVMHLTNSLTDGDKPVFFLMANIHGNEIISNEVAMVFIQYLLENYTYDPDVTWLLNEHDIYVMVSANPDGHVKNESGEPWTRWRKNTNPSNDDCDGGQYGIDLNRNFGFKWGVAGSDRDPCGINYRGPSPVSEYETQAIQTFMLTLFPDQRGPEETDAAPADATGIFITLHSYGNLILWPWGYTDAEAPNALQLQRLGQKFAAFTGYTPQQSYFLYPSSGTTDDWSYGEMGIASYTFEIGAKTDGHYPPCSRYDALVQPNIQALLYAAKVARTPYLTSSGPDVLSVTSTPTWALQGRYLQVSATIEAMGVVSSMTRSILYSQTIGAAEAYLDVPPWEGGVSYPLEATDGAFDDFRESVQGQVPLLESGAVTSGKHLVFVRGRNGGGEWGPVSSDFFTTSFSSLMPTVAVQSGLPDARVPYTLTLSNIDVVTHTFRLTHSANRWPTVIVPIRIKELSPAGCVTVVVTVTVPSEGNSLVLFSSDVVTVTASAEDDLSVAPAFSVLTTKLRLEHQAFLPLIIRRSNVGRSLLSAVDIPLSFEEEVSKNRYKNKEVFYETLYQPG